VLKKETGQEITIEDGTGRSLFDESEISDKPDQEARGSLFNEF